MNDYRFSSLTICYQKSILLRCHQKDVIKLCYFNYCVSIAIIYRRQLSVIPAFLQSSELLNKSSEINDVLGDFNLDVLDHELFEQMSNTLSNICLVNSTSAHLNGSLIDQVYVREAFFYISYNKFFRFQYFSDHDAVPLVFQPNYCLFGIFFSSSAT